MRYKQLLSEQQLDEIRMSPSALRRFANSPDAEGIKIGFEAEIVFPGLGGAGNDGDYEPDYDMDERTGDIDDVIRFFEYDDYGYGISDREARNLRNQLEDEWQEYFDDAMYEDWHGVALERIRDVIENTDWDEDERIQDHLENQGLDSGQIDEIMTKAREATSSKDTPPEFREAADAAAEELDARAEESLSEQDQYYDEALDEFRDNFTGADEREWLRQKYRYMSDIADAFGLSWPYVRYEGGDEDGYDEYAALELADDLSNALDVTAKASGGYHSTTRDETTWIFEPDSSLEAESGDMPVEIISPPMPLDQGLVKLREFFAWAKTHRAYTNSSTGFHMGVSLPIKGGNVDFLKLALFLGDEHVLKEFGRLSNTYAVAAMQKIRSKVKQRPEQIGDAMTLMRRGLIELANKSLSNIVGSEKSPGFGKYTSINPKGNYIEFRSAGGKDYSDDVNKLENTLLRYARAMTIAANPAAERKEYNTKLYKLLAPQGGNSAMDLFAKFASGNISKEELKKQWAEATLEKEAPQEQQRSSWKVFDKTTGQYVPGVQYNGYTESEAMALFKQSVSPGSSWLGFKQLVKDRYEFRNISTSTGKWAIINRDTGETLEVIDTPSRGDAADLASEKFAGQDYYIEPVPADTPKPKLSRRVELAKRIKEPKTDSGSTTDSGIDMSKKYYILDQSTNKIVHTYDASDLSDAYNKFSAWKGTQQDRGNFKYGGIAYLSPEQRAQYTSQPAQPAQPTQQAQQAQQDAQPQRLWQAYRISTNGPIGDPFPASTHHDAFEEFKQRVLSGTDQRPEYFDVREVQQTTAPANTEQSTWEIRNNSNEVVHRFEAPHRTAAIEKMNEWLAAQGISPFQGLQYSISGPHLRAQQSQPVAQQAQQQPNQQVTTDAGIPMWEIYDRRSGSALTRFPDHDTTAWATAQQWLRDAHVPEDRWNEYSVRPLTTNQPAASSQPVAGSTQDRQQQRAAGEFTGSWKIVNSNTGEELHRFSGVGNVQADANRVARQWIQRARIDDPVEVLPIIAESLKLTKNILGELNNWVDTVTKSKNRK